MTATIVVFSCEASANKVNL